ncbi:hypothetical protein [uncultured Ellagibacter sp.]|nr:hypothetical protein [uncultured Ellagibacter sp.]
MPQDEDKLFKLADYLLKRDAIVGEEFMAILNKDTFASSAKPSIR